MITSSSFTLRYHAHHHHNPVIVQGAKAALKEAALLALASDAFKGGQTIVFFSTKQAAHRARLQFGLAELPPVAELHGNLTQAQRLEALEAFRQVRLPVRRRALKSLLARLRALGRARVDMKTLLDCVPRVWVLVVGCMGQAGKADIDRTWMTVPKRQECIVVMLMHHVTGWPRCRARRRSCWPQTWQPEAWTSWGCRQ